MELADALLVNKADGDNKIRANAARADYNQALHYLAPATEGWRTKAYTCSALNGEGIDAIWKVIDDFRQHVTSNGAFAKRRQRQTLDWVYSMVEEHLRASFFNHAGVASIRADVEYAVIEGRLPPTVAAQQLIHKYEGH
jgi:LAO/AO transport system kinase